MTEGGCGDGVGMVVGMTWAGVGMMWEGAGMTGAGVGMTWGMGSRLRGNDVGGCGNDGGDGFPPSRE